MINKQTTTWDVNDDMGVQFIAILLIDVFRDDFQSFYPMSGKFSARLGRASQKTVRHTQSFPAQLSRDRDGPVIMRNPSKIKNKIKRQEVYGKYKEQKKKLKKKLREMKVAEVEALGEAAPPKQIPRTIENTRANDLTFVKDDDEEVAGDEMDDEFAEYFSNEKKPKIMITTRPKCSKKLFLVIADLMQMVPNAFYYPRGVINCI